MGLEIRKISAKVWKHINDVDGEFILSKFYVKEEFSKFLIVEVYGSKRRAYPINKIEVYNVGGAAETFTTFTALFTRLEALGYPAFYQDGDAPQIPLSNLTDVEIDGLTDGQILKYNALSGKWENADESGGGGTSNLIHYKIHWYNRTQTTGAGAVEFVDGFLAIPANTLQADDKIIVRTQFGDMGDSITTFTSEHVFSDQVRPIYNNNGRIGSSSNNRRTGGFSREIRVVSEGETRQFNQGSTYWTDFYFSGYNSTYNTQNSIFLQNLFTEDTYYNLYVNCPATRDYNVIFTEIYVYRNS